MKHPNRKTQQGFSRQTNLSSNRRAGATKPGHSFPLGQSDPSHQLPSRWLCRTPVLAASTVPKSLCCPDQPWERALSSWRAEGVTQHALLPAAVFAMTKGTVIPGTASHLALRRSHLGPESSAAVPPASPALLACL